MKLQSYEKLKDLLTKLKSNSGQFKIRSLSSTEENSQNSIFCQLSKSSKVSSVCFEVGATTFWAASESSSVYKLEELGFKKDYSRNFSKQIFLNSIKDIEITQEEVVLIFEEIFKADKNNSYFFEDQISTPVPKLNLYKNEILNLSSLETEFQTICLKCNAYLQIPKKFEGDSLIKCPNCKKTLKNPLFIRKREIEKESKAGYGLCPSCNRSIYISANKVNDLLIDCPKCSKIVGNPIRKGSKQIIKGLMNWFILVFFLILAIGFFIGISGGNSGSSGARTKTGDNWYVTETTYVAKSRGSFREMFRLIENRDEKALRELLYSGQIEMLYPGTRVYIVNGGLTSSVVRREGSREQLWVVNEHISQRR